MSKLVVNQITKIYGEKEAAVTALNTVSLILEQVSLSPL